MILNPIIERRLSCFMRRYFPWKNLTYEVSFFDGTICIEMPLFNYFSSYHLSCLSKSRYFQLCFWFFDFKHKVFEFHLKPIGVLSDLSLSVMED